MLSSLESASAALYTGVLLYMPSQLQARSRPWWDCLHHRSEQMLQIAPRFLSGSCCLVTKLCPNPTNYSPPGPSVRGISQARILEWVNISYSRGSNPRLLHWQADSLRLNHQGSPLNKYLTVKMKLHVSTPQKHTHQTWGHLGSYFPNQGLNPRTCSGKVES